jgi:hypothetical protein
VIIIFTSIVIALLFSRRIDFGKKDVLDWLIPIFVGCLIVSPFLVQAAPFYLNFTSPIYTGGLPELQKELLPIRLVPFGYILPFFVCFILGFAMFRFMHLKTKFSVTLLAVWLIIPTVLTQSYLAGVYVDYERFLYFAALPLTIFVATGIFLSAPLIAKYTKKLFSPKLHLTSLSTNKTVILFTTILLLFACFFLPHFSMTPTEGFKLQGQLQVMNTPQYDAIQWIKNNTPTNSVIVSDALYGWWLGGFAQRRTVSAVEPVFLTNQREFEPAHLATRLLDSDYLVDNGLIQIQEDGGYTGNRNPEFLAKMNNSYYPYSFLNFNNSQTTITYKINGDTNTVKISELSVKEMHIENSSASATISITVGNQNFNLTQKTTVYRGVQFVNITETFSSSKPAVSFVGINFAVQTNGNLISESGDYVALENPSVNVAAQLIFTENQPTVRNTSKNCFEILFNLNSKHNNSINFYVSVFEYPELSSAEETKNGLQQLFLSNTQCYTEKTSDYALDVFDYRQAIADLNASYVALRDFSQFSRFANDPLFDLVYTNKEVAIFEVNSHSQ